MSNNMDRVLTLRVKIKDPEKAKVIWDGHIAPEQLPMGCEIRAIADGDLFAERDRYELFVDYLEEKGVFVDGKVMDFEEWTEKK